MKKSSIRVNRLFLVFGILCILYYLLEGITVRFGQSMLFIWPLLGLACLARWLLWKRAWKQGRAHPFPTWLLTVCRVVIALCLALFVFVEFFICREALRTPPEGLDAIVVLGARVDESGAPSGSLYERITAAADYLRANPETVAVASGGQGDDEPMSEAACIRDYLVAAGIDEGRILLEDQSTSTKENLRNSFALLEGRAERVGIVTNDFHLFRALAAGRALGGYALSPVPARSFVFGFIHYAVREFFAVILSFLRGDLLFT